MGRGGHSTFAPRMVVLFDEKSLAHEVGRRGLGLGYANASLAVPVCLSSRKIEWTGRNNSRGSMDLQASRRGHV